MVASVLLLVTIRKKHLGVFNNAFCPHEAMHGISVMALYFELLTVLNICVIWYEL